MVKQRGNKNDKAHLLACLKRIKKWYLTNREKVENTLKLIPNKSKFDIYTDSEISKSLLLNDDYRGPYLPVKQEFKYLCESKKLTVKLIKVEGHVYDGNIQVDALAKEGSINGMVIKPHLLLTQNQVILKYNREWIPDISKFIWNKIFTYLEETN